MKIGCGPEVITPSKGTRAAAVGIHLALCFYTREESEERVNPVGWDVTSLEFIADQIAFLA
ncbi:hypothetical protein PAMP_009153 [Pampus punctatissimus]